jgi:hypothetical protein
VLREYALLADGERGALVGPEGDIAWMCFPRWDSDGVFSSLLGGGGIYTIAPLTRHVWGGHYEENSLIWRSRWVTDDGIVECREALAFPGDPSRAILLRRVVALQGAHRMRLELEVRGGFGSNPMEDLKCANGTWSAVTGGAHVRFTGPPDTSPPTGGGSRALVAEFDVAEGDHHDLVLELSQSADAGDPVEPAHEWEATELAWAKAVPKMSGSYGGRDARHAYAVMRGLTSGGGGMVAAATTSLPERAEQGRNYDYRYVWIRDQAYAGQAVAAAGGYPLLDDAVRFASERVLADGSALMPAYTISGEPVPEQRSIGLPGYPGGADVVGNQVRHQFQLDAFGEVLLLLAAAARHDRLDSEHWRAAETAAKAIEDCWGRPDAGIWELDDKHWAHSRLICAAGLRAVADGPASRAQGARWSALADAIVADAAADSLHPSGRWQRAPDDPRLDAALLLASVRGAVPAEDSRTLATLEATRAELTEDGYAYRFRHDEGPLGQAEGAFLLCGYFMALALDQQGDAVGAARWFERNRAACGPPGLFSEEFDVDQRQLRGNLPQAFVHALMFECAARLGASGS